MITQAEKQKFIDDIKKMFSEIEKNLLALPVCEEASRCLPHFFHLISSNLERAKFGLTLVDMAANFSILQEKNSEAINERTNLHSH